MKIKALTLFLLCCTVAKGQNNETVEKLTTFAANANTFADLLPQEKVYLHFDNTSYYLKDDIWFKCYVVASELNKPTAVSQTLYVELLTANGNILETQKLKIINGQCHGSFSLTQRLMKSGFYEIRAYTRYMLNFDNTCVFSRVFPVYDKPKEDGKILRRNMVREEESTGNKRPKSKGDSDINLNLFPEGGRLIDGLETKIAFVATNKEGARIEVIGKLMNSQNETIISFSSLHKGMGSFPITPSSSERYKIEISDEDNNKKIVDLPAISPSGYVMNVENSTTDKISLRIAKTANTPIAFLGLLSLTRDRLSSFNILDFTSLNEVLIQIPTNEFPSGVSNLILFNTEGLIVSERKIFINNKNEILNISHTQIKEKYNPYEQVNMQFAVSDKDNKAVQTSFSLAIRDASSELVPLYNDNVMSNLLLSSDIEGHIESPAYYFEDSDSKRKQDLDLLMLTQGWTRYNWDKMTGQTLTKIEHEPERGILIDGVITSAVREKPMVNTKLSVLLSNAENSSDFITTSVTTDDKGAFIMQADITGDWVSVFQTKDKDKKQRCNILLNRLFSPPPSPFLYSDTQFSIFKDKKRWADSNTSENDPFADDINDSVYTEGIDGKVHHLEGVSVEAKVNTSAREENLNASNLIYDAQTEVDNLLDGGEFLGEDIYEYLTKINKHFTLRRSARGDEFLYKNREILFVINNVPIRGKLYDDDFAKNYSDDEKNLVDGDQSLYEESFGRIRGNIGVSDINEIAISESHGSIMKYTPPNTQMLKNSARYGSVVFIYTLPGEVYRGRRKGIRRTKIQGYALTKEFFNPNYDQLPPEPDYRRTLYWNPNVETDITGKTSIIFYNNSNSNRMIISAECATQEGKMGVLQVSN